MLNLPSIMKYITICSQLTRKINFSITDPRRAPGDNNCDGVVDFRDPAILCANWLAGAAEP
jgi:hypothetical protein